MTHHLERSSRWAWTMALGTMVTIVAASPARAGTAEQRLVVAWNDAPGGGFLQALDAAPPWGFLGAPRALGADAVLRLAHGAVFAVQPGAGRIDVFRAADLAPIASYNLGAGSQPVDVAVVGPGLAYVSRAGATHLLRLDLLTGATTGVVDLGVFADPDGVPDMNRMIVLGGRLFVQLRRLDQGGSGNGFVPPAMLAVVDVATETLVDTDPETLGTQAIVLAGMSPRFDMQVIPGSERLLISATGDFFDDGGLEAVDLTTLRSEGLLIAEVDGNTGADLGAFVMVSPDVGYLTFSTDLTLSSHLTRFSLSGGVELGQLHATVEYFVPALVHDPARGTLFYPEAAFDAWGVRAFDAETGAQLTTEPVATSGPPSDLLLLDAEAIFADGFESGHLSGWS